MITRRHVLEIAREYDSTSKFNIPILSLSAQIALEDTPVIEGDQILIFFNPKYIGRVKKIVITPNFPPRYCVGIPWEAYASCLRKVDESMKKRYNGNALMFDLEEKLGTSQIEEGLAYMMERVVSMDNYASKVFSEEYQKIREKYASFLQTVV
ncbi:MAG: hypothetical protein PHC66_01205 [Candidatus Nanoarchaeia archaeon]|nr:hypothetical protein [Candidatus Nanoarchaeia archaeon]MDD5239111.1 hypothetical protein [Candidatus Nanoarchaeia archaeon]